MKRLVYVLAFVIIVFAVTKIVIGLSHIASHPETTAAPSAYGTPTVDSVASADGVMICYDVRREGSPALVFVHCWSCDRSYWREQVDEFAEKNTVVTIDLAGHGQSGQNRQEWTIPAFGADVAAVVNKLGLDSVILIGHSMGGMVIVEAARQLPGKVVGLIGIDCYNDVGDTYSSEEIEAYLAPFREDFKSATYQMIASMLPENADSALRHDIAENISSAPPDIALASYLATVRYVYTDPIQLIAALRELNLPVRGINCDLFPLNDDSIKSAVPSFTVKVMPGVGHFLHLEDPDTFNRLLHETIAELTPASLTE
jgi:pimeloyl-ACP methyl ester carboxylesterase